jgi:hypothetical protein
MLTLQTGKKAEAVILKTNHDIGERVKELTCLYFLTKLVSDPEKSMVDILQECVNSIPPLINILRLPQPGSFLVTRHSNPRFFQHLYGNRMPLSCRTPVR